MNTVFRLNWLRESAVGHLEADLGTTVLNHSLELAVTGLLPQQQSGKVAGSVSLSDALAPWRLPQWAQRRVQQFFGDTPTRDRITTVEAFCNRIRDGAWDLEQTDLFLPYFGRRDWIDRFSLLPEIAFERSPDGLVASGVRPHSLRELALRTAAAAFTQTTPSAPLAYRNRTAIAAPWRNRLLERYGLEVPAEAPPLASFSIDAHGGLLECWQNTPRERHCHYYSVFSRVALAVQYLLRRWTLATFALGVDELTNFDCGGDVIVYSATRPHAEKRTRDYSYDVLDAGMMEYAFGRATRRLEPLMEAASDLLLAAGKDEDARQYLRRDPRLHAPRLALRARKRSRVRAMLVSEGVLIYALIRFANRLKSLESARAVTAAVEELTGDFDERIRKLFFFTPDPQDFSTLIFLEASNAIQTAMGGEQALEVACETADGRRYQNVRLMAESFSPL